MGDSLQCAYHGMRFSPEGVCTKVPGQTDIPSAACVKTFPVVDKYNLTWVWVGDPVEGVISTGFYTTDDKNPTNVKFLVEYAKVDGSRAPNYAAVTTYDAMHIIYEIIKKTDGKFAPEQLIALAKGMEIESLRCKLKIDPETRDAIMDVYFRKVVRDNGKLVNRNFAKIPNVRDPAK